MKCSSPSPASAAMTRSFSSPATLMEQTKPHAICCSTLSRSNDVICCLTYDPLAVKLPPAEQLVVSNGELQVELRLGQEKVRKSILDASDKRMRAILSWQHELGIPVLPISTAEDVPQQVRHLLGQLCNRGGAYDWPSRQPARFLSTCSARMDSANDWLVCSLRNRWTSYHVVDAFTVIRRWLANRYRREALRELATPAAGSVFNASEAYALAAWPREKVASLERRCMAQLSERDRKRATRFIEPRQSHRRDRASANRFIQRRRADAEKDRGRVDPEASCTGLSIHGCCAASAAVPCLLAAASIQGGAGFTASHFLSITSARHLGLTPQPGAVVPKTNWLQKILAPICWCLIDSRAGASSVR